MSVMFAAMIAVTKASGAIAKAIFLPITRRHCHGLGVDRINRATNADRQGGLGEYHRDKAAGKQGR